MVALTIVNTKLKRVDIVGMKLGTAIEYVRKVAHIPPQYRFVRIVAYRCGNSYEELFRGIIDNCISKMMPTHDELYEWAQYPIYIKKRKE